MTATTNKMLGFVKARDGRLAWIEHGPGGSIRWGGELASEARKAINLDAIPDSAGQPVAVAINRFADMIGGERRVLLGGESRSSSQSEPNRIQQNSTMAAALRAAILKQLSGGVERYDKQKWLFDEQKHPRGHQGNAGQFAPKGSLEAPKATRLGSFEPAQRVNVKMPQPSHAPNKAGEMKPTKPTKDGMIDVAAIQRMDGGDVPKHIAEIVGKIPPAWKDVRIALDPESEVMATGRDAKGHSKTVYKPSYEMMTQAVKFARVREGLKWHELMADEIDAARKDPKTKEQADIALLILHQGTRPGSESDVKGTKSLFGATIDPKSVTIHQPGSTYESIDKEGKAKVTTRKDHEILLNVGDQPVRVKDKKARAEMLRKIEAGDDLHDSQWWLKSHGATTLEGRHVVIDGDETRLEFMGKESVFHRHVVSDPNVAKMLRERKAASPKGKLFKSTPTNLNKFIGELDGGHFTAKDFRTMKATSMAIDEVAKRPVPTTELEYHKACMEIGVIVSGRLGNESEQALSTYIDPQVFEHWRQVSGGKNYAIFGGDDE